MKFSQSSADIFVPDASVTPAEALAQTTHLCVAAHQDDIEIMAYSGIAECHGNPGRHFTGVVVTDGAGSPRSGPYAGLDGASLCARRRREQRQAAEIGDYGLCVQLAHPSAAVRENGNAGVGADLRFIFEQCRPEVVYLHNPVDKHDTHIAVLQRCLEALRALPVARRPLCVLGCEVWRDLDWLPDHRKVALDTSRRPHLAAALLAVFDSQISGGKRYDLAALGRRTANATFDQPREVDRCDSVAWAVDLAPLVALDSLSLDAFLRPLIEEFRDDAVARARKFTQGRG